MLKMKKKFSDLVENLTYRRGDTNLGAALEQLAKIDFAKESGNRPEVPDILIIITDGKANDFPKIPAFALMSMVFLFQKNFPIQFSFFETSGRKNLCRWNYKRN